MILSRYMQGLTNAPFDSDKCKDCGDVGLYPVYCCSGHHCGCYGLPVEFVDCKCGLSKPTDEQIESWAKKTDPCPVCHYDCSGANPPVLYCPMKDKQTSC